MDEGNPSIYAVDDYHMARRVFFSFHYADIWRVSQVRNSGVVRSDLDPNQPVDHAAWESIRRSGSSAVKKWIDDQLNGAGVTVVLIGSETHCRPYCRYEIEQSIALGKGLLGIHINGLKGNNQQTKPRGRNPLDDFDVTVTERILLWEDRVTKRASSFFRTYDWKGDDGYSNLSKWVEQAARIAGR